MKKSKKELAYSWVSQALICLCPSLARSDHSASLSINPADIYESDASRRRECLYYLALGHYKLKNYTESKKFTARLLSKEPGNMQALSLNDMIDEDVRKEGLIGMAIAGGAIAIIGGITVAALKSLRSR